jgi:hypothetical protein
VVEGDSGVAELVLQLRPLVAPIPVINRGVGGTTIAQIADRYETDNLYQRHILVVFDLSGGASIAQNLEAYPRIAAAKEGVQRTVFLQPGALGDAGTGVTEYYLGTPERIERDSRWEWVQDTYPDLFLEIMPALWDANDGSANDLTDVANGITPRSLRLPGDGLHLNEEGSAVVAAELVAFLQSKGWI